MIYVLGAACEEPARPIPLGWPAAPGVASFEMTGGPAVYDVDPHPERRTLKRAARNAVARWLATDI